MLPTPRTSRDERGTTLLEALIGLGLLAVLLVTMAWLLAAGRSITTSARRQTMALALGRARLEQLESLDFAREPLAGGGYVDVTDAVTDLSGPEPRVGGGGLASSPADSLVRTQARYADSLDAQGRWVNTDDGAARVAYVRRWRIERVGSGPGELALFDVVVAPAMTAARFDAQGGAEDTLLAQPDVVHLSGVRARRAR